MLRCSPEAFAKCPTRHICGNPQEATFMEGSECDQFNQGVMNKPMTNADRIRAMSDYELAAELGFIQFNHPEFDVAEMLEWLQQPAEEAH